MYELATGDLPRENMMASTTLCTEAETSRRAGRLAFPVFFRAFRYLPASFSLPLVSLLSAATLSCSLFYADPASRQILTLHGDLHSA